MTPFVAVGSEDLAPALAVLLQGGATAPRATNAAVRAFETYLAQCPVRWRCWRAGDRAAPAALFFALLLPGHTCIVLLPPRRTVGGAEDPQAALVRWALDGLRAERLHYVQALVAPRDEGRCAVLAAAGFREMAPLVYLERNATYPWVDAPRPDEAEWIAYGPATHALFTETILKTYENSQDCPELTGLRPIEDVLAAHRAGGPFEPELWQTASVDGQAAGCILLCPLLHGPLLEVAYMGVVPTWRRRGVSGLLLRRALELARARRCKRLTLVVDERNEPAVRLYARFAFVPAGRRRAWLYRWE